jgi:hypothetical protein
MRTVRSPNPYGFRAQARLPRLADQDRTSGASEAAWTVKLPIIGTAVYRCIGAVLHESNPQDHYFGSLYKGRGSLAPL